MRQIGSRSMMERADDARQPLVHPLQNLVRITRPPVEELLSTRRFGHVWLRESQQLHQNMRI
jgi:hypothetical protein